ncbi:MAG TPA: ABC transporter substrate-binding protein, partial [Burkholderiaceae bacterium]|nr:ABC transporter substrate-binding protein [Burkholderiaceae bacterium]
KKFYEVQKHIMLTGHIVDSVTTQIAPHLWNKLTDAEKKLFVDVMQEAAARGTADIKKREGELVAEFRKKGVNVAEVDRESIRQAILKAQTPESLGYNKSDWEKIQALK